MPFPTIDVLAVKTNRNVTAPRRSVRQLVKIFSLRNFMIVLLN